jgi:hypothetical protein
MMATSRVLRASLVCLAAVQCCLGIMGESDLNVLRMYLNLAHQQNHPSSESKSHQIFRRLPPLVPPSFADEDHFDERQVSNIPRVGKSLDYSTGEVGGAEFEEGRGEQVRQVFSKIPRVGRSVRVRRDARTDLSSNKM